MSWKKKPSNKIIFFISVFVTGWKPLVNDRESSSQTDPQSFSSPSNDERDSFYKDMIGKDSCMNKNKQENIT